MVNIDETLPTVELFLGTAAAIEMNHLKGKMLKSVPVCCHLKSKG